MVALVKSRKGNARRRGSNLYDNNQAAQKFAPLLNLLSGITTLGADRLSIRRRYVVPQLYVSPEFSTFAAQWT
jgi:hypothetical protein